MGAFLIGLIIGSVLGFYAGRWFCSNYQVSKKILPKSDSEVPPPPPKKPTAKKHEGGER